MNDERIEEIEAQVAKAVKNINNVTLEDYIYYNTHEDYSEMGGTFLNDLQITNNKLVSYRVLKEQIDSVIKYKENCGYNEVMK